MGPIVAPVLGGLLSTALDWRGVFILLAAFAAPLLALLACMPETQHFHVARVRRAADAAAPVLQEEADGLLAAAPPWVPPWRPLACLLDARIAPFTLLAAKVVLCRALQALAASSV